MTFVAHTSIVIQNFFNIRTLWNLEEAVKHAGFVFTFVKYKCATFNWEVIGILGSQVYAIGLPVLNCAANAKAHVEWLSVSQVT